MLEINNISFQYDKKTQVLNNFSLSVKEGEIVAVQGKSGLGKSTVLRVIAGLEKPNQGEVILDGSNITNTPTNQRHIGYVFQNHALFPHLTVKKNIAYGLREHNQEELIQEIAKKVDIKELLNRYPHEISGGQRQRVAIARSLITKPRVLLLDEPFTGLDQELKEKVRKDIHDILDKFNITTILVTHDINDALALNARIVKLNNK